MARPSKFSDEEILAAAAKLADAGKQITGYALSVELGGGRPSSFDERYAELTASKEPAPVLPALPSDVSAVVQQLTGEVAERLTAVLTSAHASLKTQANARIDEIEQAAEKQRLSAKVELDDAAERLGAALDRAEQVAAALGAANETIHALNIDLSKLEGASEEAARQLAQVKAELSKRTEELQAAVKENASLAEKLSKTEAERVTARKAEAYENERRQAADIAAASAEAKLEQALASLTALQGAQAGMQKQLGSLEAQLQTMTSERDGFKVGITVADKRAAMAQVQLSELQGAHKQVQAELAELKKQLKAPSSR